MSALGSFVTKGVEGSDFNPRPGKIGGQSGIKLGGGVKEIGGGWVLVDKGRDFFHLSQR